MGKELIGKVDAHGGAEPRTDFPARPKAALPVETCGDETYVADQTSTPVVVDAMQNRCGCCSEEFESRNTMFEHIRQEQHAVVSDEDEEEVNVVDKLVDDCEKKRWIPGTQVTSRHIRPKDLECRDIGSGTGQDVQGCHQAVHHNSSWATAGGYTDTPRLEPEQGRAHR